MDCFYRGWLAGWARGSATPEMPPPYQGLLKRTDEPRVFFQTVSTAAGGAVRISPVGPAGRKENTDGDA